MAEETEKQQVGWVGLVLRLFFFALFELIGLLFFATVFDELIGRLAAGALGTFAAAAVANTLTVRIYERGRLEDVGMGWSRSAPRHLWLGFAGGFGAGASVVILLMATGAAVFTKSPESAFSAGRLLWVTGLLLFGAVGEELLFRGYGFQVLMSVAGPWWVVPLSGGLFAYFHSLNPAASPIGLLNTGLWGVVLGYAYYRAGDLWLPIGLHFGWNWSLVLLGANLSGFTIGVTGFAMKPQGNPLWSGAAYGPEGSLATALAAGILTFWLWRTSITAGPKVE